MDSTGPPRFTQLLTVLLVLGLLGIGAAGIGAVAGDDATDLFTEATDFAELAEGFTPDDPPDTDGSPDDLPDDLPDDFDPDDFDPPDDYADAFDDLEALEEMDGDLSPEDIEEYVGDELGEYDIPEDPTEEQLAAAAAMSMHPGVVMSELGLTDPPEFWTQHSYDGVHENERLSDTITQEYANQFGELPTVEEFSGDFEGDRRTHTAQLDQQTAIVPTPGEATAIEIIDGPAADLRQLPNGMVVSIDPDGDLAPLPEGTAYVVETVARPEPNTTLPDSVSWDSPTRPNEFLDLIGEHYFDDGQDPNHLYVETQEEISSDTSQVEIINTLSVWLKENGEYTLDADPGGIEEEMEGHSLTYASELASALRYHEIPSRVAIGYDAVNADWDGDPTVVRAMDRHAWTEVFIPSHGWLAVDPTPADKRTDTYQQLAAGNDTLDEEGVSEDVLEEWESLLDSAEGEDHDDLPETGEPPQEDDETPPDEDPPEDDEDPPEEEPPDQDPPEDDDEEIPPEINNIEFVDDPVPGEEVTVITLYDDQPVPGAEVFFDGTFVGTTDDSGAVTGEVPYTSDLTVTANHPDDTETTTNSLSQQTDDGDKDSVSSVGQLSEHSTNNLSVEDEVSLPTDIDLTTADVIVPGDDIELTFTINGSAVEGATVTFNDRDIGTTDSSGMIEAPIPESATPGSAYDLTVQRGEIEDTETIEIAEVELTVEATYLPIVTFPGEIQAEYVADGETKDVHNETVELLNSGSTFETATIENGSAAFTFPFTNAITAEMSSLDGVEPAQYDGILLWNAGAGLIGIAVLGIVGTGVYRRRTWVKQAAHRVAAIPFWVADMGMRLIRWGTDLIAQCRRTVRSWIERILAGNYLSVLRDVALAVLAVPTRIVYGIAAASRRLLAWFSRTRVGQELSEAAEQVTGDGGDGRLQLSAYKRIRKYWRWLVRVTVGRSRARTKTSQEVATHAQQHGFPRRAVASLRRAFQDVEYGQKSPEDRVQQAESAHEKLRSTEEHEDK